MKVAIVGASKLTENEERDARQHVSIILKDIMKREADDIIVISGGAKGVDTIAEEVAKELGLEVEVYRPTTNNWDGFKVRNMKIASECDMIYSIPRPFFTTACYHCNDPTHEKTAGCWTLKYAKGLGKEGFVIPLPNRSNI